MRRKRGIVSQYGGGTGEPPRSFTTVQSAFDGAVQLLRLPLDTSENYVVDLHQAVTTDAKMQLLESSSKGNIKWYLKLGVRFHRAINVEQVTDPPIYFSTEPVTSTSDNPLELQLLIALRQLWQDVDIFEQNGKYDRILLFKDQGILHSGLCILAKLYRSLVQ